MSRPHESTHQLQSVSTAGAVLDDLVSRANEILGRIAQLYGILAGRADPDGEAETELAALLQERSRISSQIGRAVLQVLAQGGHIRATIEADGSSGVREIRPPPVERAVVASPPAVVPLTEPEAAPARSDEQLAKRRIARELGAEIGVPAPVKSSEHAAIAVGRLAAAVSKMDSWLDLPQELQKSLMGLASSLARQIQDESEHPLGFAEDEALRVAFSRMTAWSREHRPGFVPGLSRSNMPDHGSWLNDGRHWWRELHQGVPLEQLEGTPEYALASLGALLQGGVEQAALLRTLHEHMEHSGLLQTDPRLIELLRPHAVLLKGAEGLPTLLRALTAAGAASTAGAEAAAPEE